MTDSNIPYHLGLALGGYNHGIGNTNQTLHGSAAGAAMQSQQQAYLNSLITRATFQRPSERELLKQDGIKVGEITCYRIWSVKDGYLGSYSADHIWPPKEIMKSDPKPDNSEGIWAFKEKSRALNKMMDGNYVMGSVKIWGSIIEYSAGYRAEFAKIVSLDAIRPRDNKMLDKIRKEYGVV